MPVSVTLEEPEDNSHWWSAAIKWSQFQHFTYSDSVSKVLRLVLATSLILVFSNSVAAVAAVTVLAETPLVPDAASCSAAACVSAARTKYKKERLWIH